MNALTSWIKAWSQKFFPNQKKNENKEEEADLTQEKKVRPNSDFYENYFSLVAAGTRLKLIEAMFGVNLFSLFENKAWVFEKDIVEKLQLMPIRARKWLHLLSLEHFLIQIKVNGQQAYQLPEEFIELIHSEEFPAMEMFFKTWLVSAEENLTDVLRFGKVKTSVSWPPKTQQEAEWLEDWMTRTVDQPTDCLLKSINFKKVNKFLDVGGGDGTMACTFVKKYPHLKAAVYNLPMSAQMARNNIESRKLNHRVHVIEGDFIEEDAFPVGYDLILFTRVLFDWDDQVCRKLLRMAYQALPKNGLVGICEFYKEDNNDICLASEYRYIFHDDFGVNVMKRASVYQNMLEKIGFTIVLPHKVKEMHFYYCSLILARK
ncbi:TPA: methyltransferase [Legionella pneumophila]|uniref:methyltransferase n=1 Tax=Legionella pneumophila TaxID=446 RepID=UPI000776F013|nr:methyltransferase [Legionella pneumophila]HAT8636636.1 methyltransferase [Legionella pneumophila]